MTCRAYLLSVAEIDTASVWDKTLHIKFTIWPSHRIDPMTCRACLLSVAEMPVFETRHCTSNSLSDPVTVYYHCAILSRTDPVTSGVWQRSCWSTDFSVTRLSHLWFEPWPLSLLAEIHRWDYLCVHWYDICFLWVHFSSSFFVNFSIPIFTGQLDVWAWLFGHMLFWVSFMHVFCIFVFALVQRNRVRFIWKGALEIHSLLLNLIH